MTAPSIPISDLEHLMTNADVCRRLGISDTHLDRLNKRGRIPAIKTRGGRLYHPAVIEQIAREREARKGLKETETPRC